MSLVSPPLILVCFSLFSFHSMMSIYQLFLRKLKVGSSTLYLFLFFPWYRMYVAINFVWFGSKIKILLFVFKAIHGFTPTYLRELVSIKRSGNYNLRSSSDGLLLATPTYRSRVTLGDRSFQVAAPALWNVLPREIRSITDLGIFKRHLKTHLFREAFY